MTDTTVRTQAEFDAAVRAGVSPIYLAPDADVAVREGEPCFVAWGSSQPRVVAWGSSQPRVEAWESSQPRVVARESSQPRVVAWESSQPRVVARESSQPRVVARESSQPRVVAWESSQPRVEAWGSSQPRVEARESSQPRVEARESSQPRVVAWESSQPRVVARESSQPRVEAWGFVQLALQGRVVATCGPRVQVLAEGPDPDVSGGLLQRFALSTPADWCDYYGAQVVDGVARLFKAVGDDYRSGHGALYLPGTTVEATDWDGGRAECGGGLHFCAHPRAAQGYHAAATHYVACPVRLTDCRPPQPTDQAPNKIKARAVCGPIVEVDEDGDPVPVTVTAAPESRTAAPVPAQAKATPKRRARKPKKKRVAAKGRRR